MLSADPGSSFHAAHTPVGLRPVMGQCDKFNQHVIVSQLERPGLEISDRIVMAYFSGVKAAQEP